MATFIIPCALNISFEEMDGSPIESIYGDIRKSSVIRTVRCLATVRANLIREFLGWTEIIAGNVVIHLPHYYGVIVGYLRASSADTIPHGRIKASIGDDRFADYEYSVITIKYEEPQFEYGESTLYGGYVSWKETLRSASEFITLAQEGLYWGIGGGKVEIEDFEAPTLINVMTEWIVEVESIRTIPANLEDYPGKINSGIATTRSGLTFPISTLLCSGIEKEVHVTPSGHTWNATFRFLYRKEGWNYFPRPSTVAAAISWERITDGTNNKQFYESADFTGFLWIPT